jgi:hypothetical protein
VIGASDPEFRFLDLGWRHRCGPVETTSRRRPLNATNSSVARSCRWSRLFQDVLRLCVRASLPGRPSPYCGEQLSELSFSFRQPTSSDVPVVRLSLRGISTRPSSSCRWVSEIPPIGALSYFHPSHYWPNFAVCQLLPSQGFTESKFGLAPAFPYFSCLQSPCFLRCSRFCSSIATAHSAGPPCLISVPSLSTYSWLFTFFMRTNTPGPARTSSWLHGLHLGNSSGWVR